MSNPLLKQLYVFKASLVRNNPPSEPPTLGTLLPQGSLKRSITECIYPTGYLLTRNVWNRSVRTCTSSHADRTSPQNALNLKAWTPLIIVALLTHSTKSALVEAGNYVLTSSVFHGLAGDFWLVCVLTPRYYAFYAFYTASAEIRCLHVSGEQKL